MKKLMLAAVLFLGAGVATSKADVSVQISAGHHSDYGSRYRVALPAPHFILERPAVVVASPGPHAYHDYEAERRHAAYHHEIKHRYEAYHHAMDDRHAQEHSGW